MTVALVPSPLVGGSVFEPLRDALAGPGRKVVIAPGEVPAGPPYWRQFADSIAEVCGAGPTWLVGHSGAGAVLPLVANRLGDRCRGISYLDATLLSPGERWIDTFSSADLALPEFTAAMRRGVMPNPWMTTPLWKYAGVEELPEQERFAAGARELPLAWYREVVPETPLAPVASSYLAFVPNPFYAPQVAKARTLGWRTTEMAGRHFHFLVEPGEVAAWIVESITGAGE